MEAALVTFALVVAALAGLVVGLCFVPAYFTVSARTGAGIRLRLRWLFGLVRVGGDEPAEAVGEPAKAVRKRAAAKKPASKRRRSRPFRAARALRELLAIEGLTPRLGRLLGDLVRSLGWQRGHIAVRAGTGDPADTGEICGVVGPLLVWLPPVPSLGVEFEPDFAEAVFDARAEGSGRLVPARLLTALGRFALSRPGRRAIKVLAWDARR